MIKIKDKIKNKIIKYGTKITISGQEVSVLIRQLNTQEARNYLDDIEIMALIKPALCLVLPYDATVSDNSVFTLNSRSYTIKKVTPFMCGDEIIFKTAISY